MGFGFSIVGCCKTDGGTTTTQQTAYQMDEATITVDIVSDVTEIALSQTPLDEDNIRVVKANGTWLRGYDWEYNAANNSIVLLFNASISSYPNRELIVQTHYEYAT